MNRTYRSGIFAERGGVSVRTLRHYDRLGLLKPCRTGAGQRIYRAADLERLRWIRALKQLGIPLIQIRPLLEAGTASLASFLRGQRQLLADERARLTRTERALVIVEESLNHEENSHAWSRLADVLELDGETEALKHYFSEDVWQRAQRFYRRWPSPAWMAVCRDIATAMDQGMAHHRSHELMRRWNALAIAVWTELSGDLDSTRKLHEGFARAWRDRDNWPPVVKRRFADYRMEDVAAFLAKAAA